MNNLITIRPFYTWTKPLPPLVLEKYKVDVLDATVNFSDNNVIFRVQCINAESGKGRIMLVPVSLFDFQGILESEEKTRFDFVLWRAASYYDRITSEVAP